jgi:AraC family transcriptional regulator, transcriptional activator of pobA
MQTVFRTLQQFFESINIEIAQDFEMTVHRLEGLHGDGPKKSPLFRTDYFAFLLITGGKSSYTIDEQRFGLDVGSFYFTNPGHLKSFEIEEPLKGYMITFSESFVRQHIRSDFFDQFPFLLHESTPVMELSSDKIQEIQGLIHLMLTEYQSDSAYKKMILTNQLMVFLYKTKELLSSHQVIIRSSGRARDLVNQFKGILNDNFIKLGSDESHKILSVKEIANIMAVHPNYLGNVVKEETGKTATEYIQERTLSEAKSLLKNTHLTVSEIAFKLGFTDSTHFAKFFKKASGSTPGDFRKSQHS